MGDVESQTIEMLNSAGSYGPGSKVLEKLEYLLTRYFEREHKRLKATCPRYAGITGNSH